MSPNGGVIWGEVENRCPWWWFVVGVTLLDVDLVEGSTIYVVQGFIRW